MRQGDSDQRKLAALDRISSEALRARNLDELLPRLLQVVVETAAGLDIACLFLKEGDRLVHRAAVGVDATSHGQVCIQIGEGLAGKVAAERRPMAAVRDERDESEEGALLRARAIKALYAAPLLAEDRLLGVVQMGSASLERFSDEDLALLREVAERAAAALYQAELRDETGRVAAELEKALAQRQVALDAARLGWWRYSPQRRVLNTDRRTAEILGVLSHELRNHLSPIRNGLYILEHSAPGSERARGAHSIVDRQLGHLTRLVDDLLDVTRVGRGKIRLVRRRIDLVDVVRRTVEDQRGVVQDRELEVALPEAPLWSNADPTRLEQVVSNLLQNAAKFTPEHGGTVTAHSEGPGQGSRFTVRLPLAAGDDDAPADVLARAARRDAGD